LYSFRISVKVEEVILKVAYIRGRYTFVPATTCNYEHYKCKDST